MIRCKLLIPIFIVTLKIVFAQDSVSSLPPASDTTAIGKLMQHARELFNTENYFDAVTEFKRVIFFDSTEVYRFEANETIARAYRAGGRFSDALRFFTFAEIASPNDSLRFLCAIEKVKISLLLHRQAQAESFLRALSAAPEFSGYSDEIRYWRGWVYIFSSEWQLAAETFALCDSASFLKNFCFDVNNSFISINFVDVLSAIFPGAGQIVLGEWESGLLSCLWTFGSGYAAAACFVSDRVLEGSLLTALVWLRFYRGNLENTHSFAEAQNRAVSDDALRWLQEHYKGKKP